MLPLCTSTLCRVYVSCIRAFDVDLLYQAECHRLPIGEIAVKWQEIDGSRLVSMSFAHCIVLFVLQFNLHNTCSSINNVKIVYMCVCDGDYFNPCVLSNRLEADAVLELATDGSGSTVD